MTSLKAVCSLWVASLHSYFGRQSSYISEKLRLDFPTEKDKFNFKRIDYIVLGFMFASLSGWQAIITGREDISEFIGVFFALSISFWGFSGVWEGLNKAKVTQPTDKKPKKLKAWLIKKGWVK